MLTNQKLGFIGGGNMAEAIIKGLVAGGFPAAEIMVAEPFAERRTYLSERYGVAATGGNLTVAADCTAIILSVKPQVHAGVLQEIAEAVSDSKLVISIMAGVSTGQIAAKLAAGARVVRVMPNTPALVLEAATAICGGTNCNEADLSLVQRIFELVGKTCTLDEKLMDAVTGLSGSGPAYVLMFIEALSDAGVKNGLPRDIATSLAAQTVLGSARLLLETREHPAVLRDKVTSPGGTTIAGLAVLEQEGFRNSVIKAVDAATARSRELGRS